MARDVVAPDRLTCSAELAGPGATVARCGRNFSRSRRPAADTDATLVALPVYEDPAAPKIGGDTQADSVTTKPCRSA
jgi:hypothetical protein